MHSSSGTLDPPAEAQDDARIVALGAEIDRLRTDILARDYLLAVAAHEMRNPMHTLLLDAARLESRARTADRSEFDLCRVVRETCASFEPDAQFADTPVHLDLPPELRGNWDRLAVEQIVADLVSNAIKYGQGSPIRISLQAQDTLARLVVADGGIGISTEDQQKAPTFRSGPRVSDN